MHGSPSQSAFRIDARYPKPFAVCRGARRATARTRSDTNGETVPPSVDNGSRRQAIDSESYCLYRRVEKAVKSLSMALSPVNPAAETPYDCLHFRADLDGEPIEDLLSGRILYYDQFFRPSIAAIFTECHAHRRVECRISQTFCRIRL